MNQDRIAVLAGDGELPLIVAKRIDEKNSLALVIVLQGNKERFNFLHERVAEIAPGRLKKILKLLEKEKIDKVIMIGKIDKQGFIERKGFDMKALSVIKRMRDGKDVTIFSCIQEELKQIGVDVLPQDKYIKDMLAKKGVLTQRTPKESILEDANFGMRYARKLATMDIGQTIVVKNKTIIAVEAVEGTNETIKRGGILGRGSSVVCKAARKKQDARFDIPVVGLETIKVMAEHKCATLAVESGKILIAGMNDVINFANKKGIAILGL
ncbi:MAG: UDP-2,3-diacylglucosamine diphosphatase LpxI [Spirochaetota bacterium]|nr:UDP-2,3-diacylglucosamine diphosphatase LpxI [Spirochaetota bacterium]